MSEKEKGKLRFDYILYLKLLDFYAKNRSQVSMSDVEYENYLNDILDEINRLKKILGDDTPKSDEINF